MTKNIKQGIYAEQSLSDLDIAAIRALADICASYDDLDLRLSWSELGTRAGDGPENLLYYQDGTLIGFLALSGVGTGEAEVAGMVHPRYRRQGVFTALVDAAQEICRRHATFSLMFVFDQRSDSARAFLGFVGAEYAFSEHRMRLDAPAGSTAPAGALDFQAATLEDADAIAQIIADDTGMNAATLRSIVACSVQEGSRQYYLARVGGEAIGTINVDIVDGEPYIYGFVVRPEQRGRGYGRQILARVIERVVDEGPPPVFIEVQTDNQVALALYRSFGFAVTHTHDYYRVKT
ncbi:MAG: GNAT family N-acetyltransferase [Roseiflexaceae bacterium]